MTNDTICAISTPAGVGGIAVIRVSGSQAVKITQGLWQGRRLDTVESHTAHLGNILDTDGSVLDQAVAVVYRAPRSFTGEDVVEISVHGSVYVQRQTLNALINAGARLADPGEFTRRAFGAGKMDLAQAEAVADLISAQSRAAHRIAINQMRGRYSERLASLRQQLIDLASLLELELDFSEEDVEFASREQLLAIARDVQTEVNRLAQSFAGGSAIKNGIPVAIIGATNAGKSSLLNILVDDERAIVSDIHGTTRDIVEDTLNIGDYTFRLMDTAGLRSTDDTIERLGMERSLEAAARARIVILVIDSTAPTLPVTSSTGILPVSSSTVILPVSTSDARLIVVVNKTDLPSAPELADVLADPCIADATVVRMSARTGEGLSRLTSALQDIAAESTEAQDILVTNARHYQALCLASESITRAIAAIEASLSGDLIALDIRQTISHLGEILGQITSQDLLNTIFSRFCIGK